MINESRNNLKPKPQNAEGKQGECTMKYVTKKTTVALLIAITLLIATFFGGCASIPVKTNGGDGDVLPKKIVVGDRTYEVFSYLRDGEKWDYHTMVERAKEVDAHLGQDDGEYLLDYQGDIPVVFRERVAFFFTGWSHPAYYNGLCYIIWSGDKWVKRCHEVSFWWLNRGRVLRRIK